jgi:hypothetical protein
MLSVADASAPAAGTSPFVLNLCSSSTPMALAQTELPELKRFTFFVSRRFEEGRERFRLHMGYFATLAEAEEWLGVVREIYPGAWAGEAPGRKLRERAAAAAAAQARHAAGPQSGVAPSPRARFAEAGPPAGLRVPVVHAAPAPRAAVAPRAAAPPSARPASPRVPGASTQVHGLARPAPAVPARPQPTVARPAAPHAPLPGHGAVPTPAVQKPAVPKAAAAVRAAPAPAAAPIKARPAAAARPAAPAARPAASLAGTAGGGARSPFEDSNVREVLAALGETSATGETRLMKAPPVPREPPAAPHALSDTQVLRVLEDRGAEEREKSRDAPASSIPMLKPDDTGTRKALKEAVVSNAPVAFAVQLQWSVQPVELDKVPPLAIFSAYTLYTVEGSREGRRWYGLRLGFFSDAISAKQVAYYVRSEFGSVAVVPVSPQERARATEDDQQAATLATPAARRSVQEEFKLIDDVDEPKMPARPSAPPATKPPAGRGARPSASAPKARSRGGSRVGARERRGAQSLEETLEILGASELAIDNGSAETLNDSGVRHLRVEVQKNSPFTRLIERLSERMKKP